MTAPDAIPVVIAGAGPVGLATALALARAGIRSTVLEKKAELDRRSRATLIVPRSLEFLERLGVLDAFMNAGQRNDSLRILRAGDRELMLDFDFSVIADETTTPFALALSQDQTEAILLEAVRSTGLVYVRFLEGLVSFDAFADHVHVHGGQHLQLDARFLVGADGAHSSVREQLGWKLEGKTYSTRAVLADVRIDPARDTTDGWLADPKAPSFTLAVRFADGVWRIIEAAVSDEDADGDLDARAQRLANAIFGDNAWRETLWTAAYRKHERRSPHYVADRVILAGDAAHLNSPAGGQGLNAGLVDAERLAQALTQVLVGDVRHQVALDQYEKERQLGFDRDVRGLTDALEKMESAPAWLRGLAFSAVGTARLLGLERKVARRLSMIRAGQ